MVKKTLYFGRHGNAVPAENTGDPRADDLARSLSAKGCEQSLDRRTKLERRKFDLVFSSPALRAIMTAEHVTGWRRDHVEVFYILDELYTPTTKDGEALDVMFEELRYAPLSAYHEHRLNSDGCLQRFGDTAADALKRLLFVIIPEKDSDEVVGIFGHAVYTQATALALLRPDQTEFAQILLDVVLDEAGMLKIVLEDRNVTEVEVLS